MEHLFQFTADRKAAKAYKQQHDKWLQSCLKRKSEYVTKFPIVQKLDDTLQKFEASYYEEKFKKGIISWINSRSMSLYSSNVRFSDDEINSFIKNFEWYNSIISTLLTNQKALQENVFGLKSPGNKKISLVSSDVNLITNILDLCNNVFAQTIKKDNEDRNRLAAYEQLQNAHKQFMKATSEYIDDISRWGVSHLEYLMFGLEPTLSNMMERFKADIDNSKPIIPDYYSQNQNDPNKTLARVVIKMMHSYMEDHYKLEDAKTGGIRMVIPKYYNILIATGNSLLRELGKENCKYFTKDIIKSLLKRH